MKVSVLFPVFNTKEEYLKEAIESILSQSFSDFEFLILNDASTNNAEEVIKSYTDPRIKYFKNEKNLGISRSRNNLIDLSKGEYLAVMDHDDVSLANRFQKQVDYLDNNPDVGVVSSYVGYIHRKGRIDKNPIKHEDICMALFARCGSLIHPASMIRKSILIDNNLKYENEFTPAEDYALWCRLMTHTRFHNIPEILFLYRKHSSNTSKTQAEKLEKSVIRVHAFLEIENPILYKKFLLTATQLREFRLFGCIPVLKIEKQRNRIRIYLFQKILIFSCKISFIVK